MDDEKTPAPETPPGKSAGWKIALKTVSALLVLTIMLYVWMMGCFLIGFSSFHPGWEMLCFTGLGMYSDVQAALKAMVSARIVETPHDMTAEQAYNRFLKRASQLA